MSRQSVTYPKLLRFTLVILAAGLLAHGAAEGQERRGPDLPQVQEQIVELTNELRRREGLEPLHVNSELNEAAGYFADYMARTDKYGHTADGRTPADRASAHGYDYCLVLENIAYVFRSAGYPTEQALAQVRHCYERAGKVPAIRLHGDCHPGNILWTEDGPHFVDLDDARMGPAMQDLWMLLSGERAAMSRQLSHVLAGYEDFAELDRRELHLVEALRTLRLIHYSGWLARRWDDPAFPAAFPWFNTQRYWQDRILELREQIALMEEAPLTP
jgi:hypothetical protein